MELNFTDSIEKFDIKLKSKPKDGVILQLHHTVRSSYGERRRIKFAAANFDDKREKLSCADNAGNVFILDFAELKFWKLPGIGTCSSLQFHPYRIDTLIAGQTEELTISFIDIETGKVELSLVGHTAPVKHISFSNGKQSNLLTASSKEAILWEIKNYTKYFTLNTYFEAQIQRIMFTPAGDHLVACFQNDTIQIWKHDSMRSVKQIIPSDLKRMKSIAFTMNGRAMAMGGLSPTLILFSMDTWKAIKSIDLTKYNIHGVQDVAFIPQVFDGGANKILAILSNDCNLHIFDIELLSVLHTISDETAGVRKVVVSPTGKYFLCILKLGEINIFNSSLVVSPKSCGDAKTTIANHFTATTAYQTPSKAKVEEKMRTCMDSARLRRILMQYGEYPDKFRPVIWRSLLDAPKNKSAYSALVNSGIHSSYKNIEKIFTIQSHGTLNSLKRLLSCLAHWCPLFGVMKFMPGFTFPFVKVLQKDPLLLFECVATILLNQCQLWFEYAPFPPLSILAMVENMLAEHDQQLLDHFCNTGTTSQIYALKILETAFSEVLNSTEWLILWDHIISNEPSFILMAVVSYNIVQRNALKKLKNQEDMEIFFHTQHSIDKKVFLKKAYTMLEETSKDNHPRQFLNGFTSLARGNCYQQFTGYPKATMCLKLAKKGMPKKFKKYTLKLLTKQSQDRIVKNDREKFVHDASDSSSEGSVDTRPYRKQERRSKEKFYCKEHCKEANGNVKEELLKSLYVTDTMENIRVGQLNEDRKRRLNQTCKQYLNKSKAL